MVIPRALIIVPLLAAFILSSYQYYRLNPIHRVRNLRFGLMAGAVLMFVAYLIASVSVTALGAVSLAFFLAALAWLAGSVLLLVRMRQPQGQ